MQQVFVYGTLRTGASNNFRMKGAVSLGMATLNAKLYRVHEDFPGVVLSDVVSDKLHGEVFSGISESHLHELDVYEGCDDAIPVSERLYKRVRTVANLENGKSVEVYIWEYIQEVDDKDRLLSGDWLSEI